MQKFAAKDIDPARVKKNVSALEAFANFKYDGQSGGFKNLAKDLMKAVPAIEASIMGSEKFKWMSENIKIKGLASPDIKFEQAAINISKIREALGMETAGPTPLPETQPVEFLKDSGGSPTWHNKLQESIDELTAAIAAGALQSNTSIDARRGGDQIALTDSTGDARNLFWEGGAF
jgi:hypothetical protein